MAKKLPCGCELGHTVIRLSHVAKELWAAYEREYYAASKASPAAAGPPMSCRNRQPGAPL